MGAGSPAPPFSIDMKASVCLTVTLTITAIGLSVCLFVMPHAPASESPRWVGFYDPERGYAGACPDPEIIETNPAQTFCRLTASQFLSIESASTTAHSGTELVASWNADAFSGAETRTDSIREINGVVWTSIRTEGLSEHAYVTIRDGRAVQARGNTDEATFEVFIKSIRFLKK